MAIDATAIPPCLTSELLTFVLSQKNYPTYLLICTTRESFLSALIASLPIPPPPAPPAQQSIAEGNEEEEGEEEEAPNSSNPPPPPQPSPHHLLVPTLLQVLSSRNVHLSFLPTLAHLRAHLAVLQHDRKPSRSVNGAGTVNGAGSGGGGGEGGSVPTAQIPLIVVYGLVAAHKDTSEWSAQGLGETLASVVEAVERVGGRVVLGEEFVPGMEEVDSEGERGGAGEVKGEGEIAEDAEDAESGGGDVEMADGVAEEGEGHKGGGSVWKQKLPLLNGSVLREGTAWSGRTVEVGTVVERWFRFTDTW